MNFSAQTEYCGGRPTTECVARGFTVLNLRNKISAYTYLTKGSIFKILLTKKKLNLNLNLNQWKKDAAQMWYDYGPHVVLVYSTNTNLIGTGMVGPTNGPTVKSTPLN